MSFSGKMKMNLTAMLKNSYQHAVFGSLLVSDVTNQKKHALLEERKRNLELELKSNRGGEPRKDPIIESYDSYFKQWGKTYPIEFQIKTIEQGGKFPQVSAMVDSMFLAELKNRVLTSGHDLDEIQGPLVFDVSLGGEKYLKLNGKEQVLKHNDVILRDTNGILASVLYGPAKRTSISLKTKNALYFAWCPTGMKKELISAHLNDILTSLTVVYGSVDSKIAFYS